MADLVKFTADETASIKRLLSATRARAIIAYLEFRWADRDWLNRRAEGLQAALDDDRTSP